MSAPEREFVSSRNEDDGHAWAYSRTRDAEMADLRPALMGWAKIAPALRAFRPQKVHRTFCRAVPEPVLTVEEARKGASPSLRFSHRAFAAQRRHGAPANAALGKSACSCRKTGVHFSGACACQERFWTQRSSLVNPHNDLGADPGPRRPGEEQDHKTADQENEDHGNPPALIGRPCRHDADQ